MMLAPPVVSGGVALCTIGMGNLKVPNGFGGSGQSLQGSVKRPTVKFEAPRYAAFKAASLSHSSTTQDAEDVLPRFVVLPTLLSLRYHPMMTRVGLHGGVRRL